MKRLSQAFDTNDESGKPVHSKILVSIVTVADLLLVAFDLVRGESAAFVLIALTGAAYGHDWGKSLTKLKYSNGNGNSNPPADPSHNGVA